MEKVEHSYRSDCEILKAFDKGFPVFQWFIDKYFPTWSDQLIVFRKNGQVVKLLNMLNDI